ATAGMSNGKIGIGVRVERVPETGRIRIVSLPAYLGDWDAPAFRVVRGDEIVDQYKRDTIVDPSLVVLFEQFGRALLDRTHRFWESVFEKFETDHLPSVLDRVQKFQYTDHYDQFWYERGRSAYFDENIAAMETARYRSYDYDKFLGEVDLFSYP